MRPEPANGRWARNLGGAARRVAEVLRAHGPRTRADLVALAGLSRPTVSPALAHLASAGLTTEATQAGAARTRGRPASVVRLTRSAGLAVGVDIGRRHIRVAAADLGHEVLTDREVRLDEDAEDHPYEVLALAVDLVDTVLREVGTDRSEVVGVGLGVPAPIT